MSFIALYNSQTRYERKRYGVRQIMLNTITYVGLNYVYVGNDCEQPSQINNTATKSK